MKYNPIKICSYISATLLVLYIFTFFSTEKKLTNGKIEEGFFINNWRLKYPTTATFLLKESVEELKQIKSIDSIVENIVTIEENNEEEAQIIPDFKKIDTSKIQRITYPKNGLFFINQLKAHLQSPSCRIIHYGDSQIEGDRISAYIRNRLQGYFGGSGPGFIPIVQAYEQISAKVKPSANWTRHAAFDPTRKRITHRKYGAYISVSRFTPQYNIEEDTLLLEKLETTKATIGISPSKMSYDLLDNFTTIGLHYGNAKTPTSIKVYNSGELISQDTLKVGGNYHKFAINLPSTPSNLLIELETKVSPDFYGVTLDGASGISLDNVAMRGATGTIFATLDNATFNEMYQELQPKVLIFQFGGNTVPHLKDSTGVIRYANQLKNHINWVRSKTNNASIIFIGPSDMTTKERGELVTYRLLPYLNSVLKQTCFENNIAYWNMYKAMGGKNAMKHWVNQRMAAKDYTHFSPKGTKVISELFFLALYMDLIKNE